MTTPGASRVLVATRVKASQARAFEVFTREIDLWWQRNGLFDFLPGQYGALSFEPRVGGAFTETFADGRVLEIGRTSVWEPPERFVFSWRPASFSEEQTTEVHVRFEAVGTNETRVTVEHFGWDSIPREHVSRHGFPDSVFLMHLGEWWRALLSRMSSSLEAGV